MAKYIQEGSVINYTASTAVKTGDVIVIGSRIAVAINDINKGDSGSLATTGVFAFPLKDAETVSLGAPIYWNGSAMTATATSNTLAGYVFELLPEGVAVKIG